MKKKFRLMVVSIMIMVIFCAVSVAAKTVSGSGQWKNSAYNVSVKGDYSSMVAVGGITGGGMAQTVLTNLYTGTQYGIAIVQCKDYARYVILEQTVAEKPLSGMGATITPALNSRAYGDSSVCYIHMGEMRDMVSQEVNDKLTYTAWQNLATSSTSVQEEN